MAAESLLREVEEKRKRDISRLEAEYSAKEEEIKQRAQQELSDISESARKLAAELSQREKIRINGAGKLQAKKQVFDATEKMLENNLAALKQVFAGYARSKAYNDLLRRMVKYSSRRLGDGIGVVCRQVDAGTLVGAGAKILSSNLNSIGGFKAESKDGSLELDLTFEEILRFHQDGVRALIQGETEVKG